MGSQSLQPSDSITPDAGRRRSARLLLVLRSCVHRRCEGMVRGPDYSVHAPVVLAARCSTRLRLLCTNESPWMLGEHTLTGFKFT